MGANKIYVVMKDGEELRRLKTLTAAKKLADGEGAEVHCDGKLVYRRAVHPPDSVEPAEVVVEKNQTYKLGVLMNIRSAPSLDSEKLGTAKPGTLVEVRQIKDDWMYLDDGTYILYGHGKYASKV